MSSFCHSQLHIHFAILIKVMSTVQEQTLKVVNSSLCARIKRLLISPLWLPPHAITFNYPRIFTYNNFAPTNCVQTLVLHWQLHQHIHASMHHTPNTTAQNDGRWGYHSTVSTYDAYRILPIAPETRTRPAGITHMVIPHLTPLHPSPHISLRLYFCSLITNVKSEWKSQLKPNQGWKVKGESILEVWDLSQV